MIKPFKYFTIGLALFIVGELSAQIVQFSQYYASPITMGPSFAGMTYGGRFSLNYRNQWPSINNSISEFQTYAVSGDYYLPRFSAGVGGGLIRDAAGPGKLGLTKAIGMFNRDFKLAKMHFRPGIQFSYSQRSVDMTKLRWIDELSFYEDNYTVPDGTTLGSTDTENNQYIDASASLLMFAEKYWIGFSANNLMAPDQSLYVSRGNPAFLDRKYSAYGGIKFRASKKKRRSKHGEDVTLTFLYEHYGHADQLNIGSYYSKYPLVLGFWIRGIPIVKKSTVPQTGESVILNLLTTNVDAAIFMVSYKMGQMNVGFSYDLSIGSMMARSGGASEISVVYTFAAKTRFKKRRRKGMVPCPGF